MSEAGWNILGQLWDLLLFIACFAVMIACVIAWATGQYCQAPTLTLGAVIGFDWLLIKMKHKW